MVKIQPLIKFDGISSKVGLLLENKSKSINNQCNIQIARGCEAVFGGSLNNLMNKGGILGFLSLLLCNEK